MLTWRVSRHEIGMPNRKYTPRLWNLREPSFNLCLKLYCVPGQPGVVAQGLPRLIYAPLHSSVSCSRSIRVHLASHMTFNQSVNSFLGLKSLLYIFILYSPTSVALSIISSCIGDISAEDKVCFGITVSLRMHSQLFLTSSPPLDLGYMIPTKSSPQQIINLLTNWSLSLKVHTLNLRLVKKL